MTNQKEVLTAVEKAREGLGMWGWDAATMALLHSEIRVEFVPVDQERYESLKPFRVELRTALWDRKSREEGDANVISGSCYGNTIEESFLGALLDLEQVVKSATEIVTDSDIWP